MNTKRFNWTVVESFMPERPRRLVYVAACVCGTRRNFYASTFATIDGPKSCGCLARYAGMSRNGKSGVWRKKSYAAWAAMLHRCNNKENKGFDNYGGRGIYVCPRWCTKEEGYEIFLADMGEPPSNAHSLDRIDNSGPYSPGNCRWATVAEQSRNRRTNNMLTAFGTTMCIKDWAKRLGVSDEAIRTRIRRGWSVELAVSTPSSRGFKV